ncbi:hypothetical protein E4K10_12915 [Streptomyces sp. T1317-0309]|nr:hypothetical protein E4K10_12915 [Streptomyces sp. T1317-0309]
MKGILYFDDAGVLKPVLVLCAWIAAGAALLGLDAWRHHREADDGARRTSRRTSRSRRWRTRS